MATEALRYGHGRCRGQTAHATRRPSQAPPPRRSIRDPGRPDRFHLRVSDLREGHADTT